MAIKPRIKLDKKEAKKGELVEVKALVQHVMETGQRKDASGNTIPRKILNKFTCTVNGKEVFSADFEPAIAANPYIQFKFKATESGPVVLTIRPSGNQSKQNGSPSTRATTSACPSSTTMTSPATQSANHTRPSCQRTDSPRTIPSSTRCSPYSTGMIPACSV